MSFSPVREAESSICCEALEAKAGLFKRGCKRGVAQVDQTSHENRKA